MPVVMIDMHKNAIFNTQTQEEDDKQHGGEEHTR
jgi:hypothetical protein